MVYVEDPTYFLALEVFRELGFQLRSLPTDDDGILLSLLEKDLNGEVPLRASDLNKKFAAAVYLVPTYNNPTGRSMSALRRRQLIDLAYQHNFLIICDDVYDLLHYHDGQQVAEEPLISMDVGEGRVISNCTFSKILGPGLRLGWIAARSLLLERLISRWVHRVASWNDFVEHLLI